MTPAQFRKLALSMPEACEGEHHGHPDFRVGGRIFASLQPDGERGMVKLPPADQARLVQARGGVWEPATGAWGRAGCTMVRLADVAAAAVKDAMTLAWQAASVAPPRRRRRG
jgi:hypothetical protein